MRQRETAPNQSDDHLNKSASAMERQPTAQDIQGLLACMTPKLQQAALRLADSILRNSADAHDAVQLAYIKALHYFHVFDGSNFDAWFEKIVRNEALTLLRRNKRRQGHLDIGEPASEHLINRQSVDDQPMDIETFVNLYQETELIKRAMERLDPVYKQLFIDCYVEGHSYEQLAVTYNVAIGTIMSRLNRTREKIIAALLTDHQELADRIVTETKGRKNFKWG